MLKCRWIIVKKKIYFYLWQRHKRIKILPRLLIGLRCWCLFLLLFLQIFWYKWFAFIHFRFQLTKSWSTFMLTIAMERASVFRYQLSPFSPSPYLPSVITFLTFTLLAISYHITHSRVYYNLSWPRLHQLVPIPDSYS